MGRVKQWKIASSSGGKGELSFVSELKDLTAGYYTRFAFSADGLYYFTGDSVGTVKQFSVTYGYEIAKWKNLSKNKDITALCVTSNNQYLYIGTLTGQLKRLNIKDQMVVQDFGTPHSAPITKIVVTADNRNMLTCDANGQVLQFNEQVFTSGLASFDKDQEFMVPLGVNFFNFTHDINFLSSAILKAISEHKLTMLREFIIDSNHEICLRYTSCNYYSTLDVIVMIFTYILTKQHIRIPNLIKAIKCNTKVARKDMNGLIYYLYLGVFGQPAYIGERVVGALLDYDFRQLQFFKKGSPQLVKKKCISSSKCIKDENTEQLCKEDFKLPLYGTPMCNTAISKWTVKVNLTHPSDELYIWLSMIYVYGDKCQAKFKDKNFVQIVNNLWYFYRKLLYLNLLVTVFLCLALYTEGYFLMKQKPAWHNPDAAKFTAAVVFVISLFTLASEIMSMMAGDLENYLKTGKSYTTWLAGLLSIFHAGLTWVTVDTPFVKENDQTTIDFYCFVLLMNFVNLVSHLTIIEFFRRFLYRIVNMFKSLGPLFTFGIILFIGYGQILIMTYWKLMVNPLFDQRYILIVMLDMFWKHWKPWMEVGYVESKPLHFFFAVTSIFLFFCIVMRFLVGITGDALKESNKIVDFVDQKTKLRFIIDVIELYRLLTCRRKAIKPYLNVDPTTGGYDTQYDKSMSDMPFFFDETYLRRHKEPKNGESYMYTCFEIEDKDITVTTVDPDHVWLGKIDKKLADLYSRIEMFDMMDENDEKVAELKAALGVLKAE